MRIVTTTILAQATITAKAHIAIPIVQMVSISTVYGAHASHTPTTPLVRTEPPTTHTAQCALLDSLCTSGTVWRHRSATLCQIMHTGLVDTEIAILFVNGDVKADTQKTEIHV